MYNVFSDFHHSSLLNSLIFLFEKRLGGNVYRPIGTEWAEQGFWKVFDHPATIQQFLGIGGSTPDGSAGLNDIAFSQITHPNPKFPNKLIINGLHHCKDIENGKTNKAITLDAFMDLNIDIIIASIPQHIDPFRKLANQHPNKPKLLYQIGNSWNISNEDAQLVDGILSSAKLNQTVPVPHIEYHQEFDLNVFQPIEVVEESGDDIKDPLNIFSFVNCFNIDNLFGFDWAIFQEIEKLMPEWTMRSFGGQCRDGAAHGSEELATYMRGAKFIWHTKAGGDGYGHVLHNSAAVGRPLIIRKQYYQGKMGEALIKDGETAIVIDGLSPQQIVDKILYYSEPERYRTMCQNVRDNFKRVVDFDKEFLDIKQFLENIV